MIVQSRDIELIQEIDRYQFLTKELIRSYFNLFTGNENTISRRLKKLENEDILTKIPLLNERNRPLHYVYFLKKRAYGLIDKPYVRRSIPKNFYLTHTIRLIETRLIFQRVTKADSVSCYWTDERQTKLEKGKRVKVVQERFYSGREGQNVTLIPDAVMTLKIDAHKMLYFIEFDNGTESIRSQLAKKFLKYIDYWNLSDKPFKEKYKVNVPMFRVLFITHSERRIRNIFEGLRHIGNFEFILFNTFENLKSIESLTTEIWEKCRGNQVFKTGLVKPESLTSSQPHLKNLTT